MGNKYTDYDDPQYTRVIGSGWIEEEADYVYGFALVYMEVKNASKSTATFDPFAEDTHKCTLDKYSIQLLADVLLYEGERLDLSLVPPNGERKGFLVFQVIDDPYHSQYVLELRMPDGQSTAWLNDGYYVWDSYHGVD